MRGADGSDVERSQRWFLDQVATFLDEASPHASVVVDQDPAAIVKVYGSYFAQAGRLSTRGMRRLERQLSSISALLGRWQGGYARVVLDAPASVLAARATSRVEKALGEARHSSFVEINHDGALSLIHPRRTPAVDWFTEIRKRFLAYAVATRCPVIMTDDASVSVVVQRVSAVFRS